MSKSVLIGKVINVFTFSFGLLLLTQLLMSLYNKGMTHESLVLFIQFLSIFMSYNINYFYIRYFKYKDELNEFESKTHFAKEQTTIDGDPCIIYMFENEEDRKRHLELLSRCKHYDHLTDKFGKRYVIFIPLALWIISSLI